MRRKGEINNFWISFTHPDPTNKDLTFFVCSSLFRKYDLAKLPQPTAKESTQLQLNLLPTHQLSCCYAFLGSKLQLKTWGRSVWVWESGGLYCRSVQFGTCTGQWSQGTRTHILALPRLDNPATAGLLTTAPGYLERTESSDGRSGWRRWKCSC